MEFDSSMPTNDFYIWLKLKGLSEDDLQLLKRMKSSLFVYKKYCANDLKKFYICTGQKISTASIFERLNSSNIKKLKLSVGGEIQVRTLLDELKARRK